MYIKVIVTPGAKKERFIPKNEDHFEVAVKELAKNNMANRRVLALVAEHFAIPIGKVKIITGHRSHSKIISVLV